MIAKRHLTTTLALWTLFASGTLALAQEQPPGAAQPAPPPPGAKVNPDGSVNVTMSVRPTRAGFIDANGNGTMSVFTNGVQQDYLITPQGTFLVGSQPIPPDAGTNVDAQAIARASQLASDMLRDALGCTDAQWAVLWPRIEQIRALQAAEMPVSWFVAMKNGPAVPPPVAEVRDRARELHKLVNSPDATNAQVARALESLRQARAKANAERIQAGKELTDLLTRRQEAILISRGILTD